MADIDPTQRTAARRIAGLATRRPWRVAGITLAVAAVAGIFGGPVSSLLPAGGFEDPHSDSIQARDAVFHAGGSSPDGTIVALVRTGSDPLHGDGAAELQHVIAVMKADRGVGSVVFPGESAVARDGATAYVVAHANTTSLDVGQTTAVRLRDALAGDPHVTVGGFLLANKQVTDQVSKDLGHAELLAFPILFLLLLLVFRGAVAALLPPMVGGLTILGTFLVLRVIDSMTSMSIFALNLSTGLGLGLAIDYSLLMLSRYREEVAVHGYGDEALRRTLSTAGRTVLFSSLTVTAALASLLVFPQRFLYSMGAAGVATTLLSAGVALVVLPAVLALLGRRIDSLSLRRRRGAGDAAAAAQGGWYRLSRGVMRHPGLVAAVTAAALLALGSPFLGIRFTSVDASVLPQSASARQVDDALRTQFAQNASPLYAVVQAPVTPAVQAQLQQWSAPFARIPGVETATLRAVGGAWEYDVVTHAGALSDTAKNIVSEIRAHPGPYPVLVGGETASFMDLQSSLGAHLPLAIVIVCIVTVLVLFAMTGSVVLPAKAVLMNALSLSAAFGALVLIFQDGRLTGLLHYTSQGALESTQPILLFAIAFGLSTDYGVFLLTRIKEGHDAGMSTAEAVAVGLERTGRIVTAAALLFCIAIGAFATSSIVFIKEVGVGTALAVLIDATIVRALLVPSLMALLGRWNWWAPRPLRALHRRLGLDRLEGGAVAGAEGSAAA